MEIIHLNLQQTISLKDDTCVAFGFFDGIHIAHQALFNKALEIAREKNLKSGVISFYPNPNYVLRKNENTTYLTPLNDKTRLIEEMGFDYFFVIDFSLEVAKLRHDDFVKRLLMPLRIKEIVVGFDNHYGFKGEGDSKTLISDSNNTFKVSVLPSIDYKEEKIGTSRILKLLGEANIKEVNLLLGRNYTIRGRVIHGRGVGKVIGVPTANIGLDYPYSLPKKGVYLTRVRVVGKERIAILNIGNNPTFNYVNNLSLEANILDFNEDIYGEKIELEFIDHIRDEVKFPSLEDFLAEIEENRKLARKTLSKTLDLSFEKPQDLTYRKHLITDKATMSYNEAYGEVAFNEDFLASVDYLNSFYYYIRYNDELVGEISFKDGFISLIIEASKRGRGLGTNALILFLDHLKALGFKEVKDDIILTNPSLSLFLKLGFKAEKLVNDGICDSLVVKKIIG